MTGSNRHPSESEWVEWSQSGCDLDSELVLHARNCDSCRESMEVFQTLFRAGRVQAWRVPPVEVQRRAAEVEREPAPPEPEHALDGSWFAPDIRSGGSTDLSGPRMATAQFGRMRISVVASPNPADLSVQIRGKVFLDEGQAGGQGTIQALLVHEDHVIARTRLGRGGDFSFVEHAPKGWVLEVHREPAECWILRDPA